MLAVEHSNNSICREQREKDHFDHLYRTDAASDSFITPERIIKRYRACKEHRIYGKECAFNLAKPLEGREVLEIGCGTGIDSVLLASNGARVFAYDISEQAIEVAKKRAKANGFEKQITFRVAGEISQAYGERKFDIIFGNAILHHLDLNGFSDKLRAVLKEHGKCVFREPVILNKWFGWLRKCIPWYPTNPTKDEKPLTDNTIRDLTMGFSDIQLYKFECFSRMWYLFKSPTVISSIHHWDAALLNNVPWMKTFASVAVIHMKYEVLKT